MKNKHRLIPVAIATAALMILAVQVSVASGTKSPALAGIELGYYKTDIEYVKCSLNEPFAYDRTSYTASVEQSYTAFMFITPFLPETDKGSLIRIDGILVRCGERYRVEVQMGDNPFTISVMSPDGITNNYQLNISRHDWSKVYVSELIGKGIWRIRDFGGFVGDEDMYLVEGTKKALLFDTGMGKGDLAAYIRTLTSLPVEVAISHGAGDHHGQNDQFARNRVYYPANDIGRLPASIDRSNYVLVKEGDKIDIGGRIFEVIDLPGHSLGHVIYLDVENNLAVSGDILGSGDKVYMQGSSRTSMETYHAGLKHFEEKISGMQGLTLLVGHSYQTRTPLHGVAGMQLVTDMRILAEKLMSGEIIGRLVFSTRNNVTSVMREAYYGLAGMYYNPGL